MAWRDIHHALSQRLGELGHRAISTHTLEEAPFGELEQGFLVQALAVAASAQHVNHTLDRDYQVRVTLTRLLGGGDPNGQHHLLVQAEEDAVAALCDFAWYRAQGLRRVQFQNTAFGQDARGAQGVVGVASLTLLVQGRLAVGAA